MIFVPKRRQKVLPQGASCGSTDRYAYKFLLNGARWLADPANPRKSWDGITGFNSLLIVN